MEQQLASLSPLKAFFFHEPFEQNFWPDILEEIYKKHSYVPFLPKSENSVCLDIGANVGLTTYYFSRYFSKVYSVEPSALHLESLTAMKEHNKLDNVTIIPFAASNKTGKEKFYHNGNQTMFSLESKVNNPNDFEEVDTLAFDDLFKKYSIDHVDFMKLDCEGFESKIITSEGFKKVAPRIQSICGEWHQWTDMGKDNFKHTFEDLGYTFRWHTDTEASIFEAVRL